MTTFHLRAGDVRPTIDVTVDGDRDFATATAVTATLEDCAGTSATFGGAVLDAAARRLRLNLFTWLTTPTPGAYRARWHVTFADGSVITFPRRGKANVVVVR